jgi:hypothetical protein
VCEALGSIPALKRKNRRMKREEEGRGEGRGKGGKIK